MKWGYLPPEIEIQPPGKLLDDQFVGREVEPHPAVFLGDSQSEEAQFLHLLDDRLRESPESSWSVLGVGDDLQMSTN